MIHTVALISALMSLEPSANDPVDLNLPTPPVGLLTTWQAVGDSENSTSAVEIVGITDNALIIQNDARPDEGPVFEDRDAFSLTSRQWLRNVASDPEGVVTKTRADRSQYRVTEDWATASSFWRVAESSFIEDAADPFPAAFEICNFQRGLTFEHSMPALGDSPTPVVRLSCEEREIRPDGKPSSEVTFAFEELWSEQLGVLLQTTYDEEVSRVIEIQLPE